MYIHQVMEEKCNNLISVSKIRIAHYNVRYEGYLSKYGETANKQKIYSQFTQFYWVFNLYLKKWKHMLLCDCSRYYFNILFLSVQL